MKTDEIQKKLLKHQVGAFRKAIRNLKENKPFVLSARTGFGKTVLGAAIAKEFYNKNKRIIYVTSSNNLVFDAYNEFTTGQFKFKESDVQIIIGKNNYIDPAKIDLIKDFFHQGSLEKYLKRVGVGKEEEYADSNQKYLSRDFLFETIFDKVNLLDEKSAEDVIKLSAQGKRLDYAGNLAGAGIKITNYYYLLLAAIFHAEDFKDALLILDEADMIRDIISSLLSDTLSIYSFRNSVNRVINELMSSNVKGVNTAIKNLDALSRVTHRTLEFIARPALITKGRYSKHENIYKDTLINIIDLYDKVKQNKGVAFAVKNKDLINKRIFDLFNENIENLKVVCNNNDKSFNYEIFLNFSPELGYPSYSILKHHIEAHLRSFWKKTNQALLMSGTCEAGLDLSYINEILDLPEERFPMPVIAENPFDLKNCRIHLTDRNTPDIKVKNEDGTEYLPLEWLLYYIPFIIRTIDNKNSIIFGNSYGDVNNIYTSLFGKTNMNIIKAEPGVSQSDLIDKFKKEGGILITHRGLGRGMNLAGKALEKIYICRLPYDPSSDPKYVKLSKGKSFDRGKKDMLKSLEQTIGRLIRNKDDKGDIYILDNRVYGDKIYSDIISIIKRTGVLVENEPVKPAARSAIKREVITPQVVV